MPVAPIETHLNLVSQNVMTIASWVLTLVLLGYAVQLGRKEKTHFYTLIVLAAMVGAFGEPLYDEAFGLYFYTNGGAHGLQTFFTAFNVPQPIWTHSGYALLYALPAVFVTKKIRSGTLTPQTLWNWAGVELVMSCAFEITGINIGTYTYYGAHVLRIAHYPIVIGILETAQVMCFSVAAAHLRARSTRQSSHLGLFAIFPLTFFGANFGAGFAVIVAIHSTGTTQAAIYVGTLVSIGLAAVLIRLASQFIPGPAVAAGAADVPSARLDLTVPRQSLAGSSL